MDLCPKPTLTRDPNGSRPASGGHVTASGGNRPKPGTGSHEIIALSRPFAACGNLRRAIMEPNE